MPIKQIIIAEVDVPGGKKGLTVNAGDMQPSEVLKLIAETLATLGNHIAGEYEAKRIELATEVPL